jgi:hypothetical protein
MFGGGGGSTTGESESSVTGDADYEDATEDDINTLSRILGGAM